jgi:hypothetical protein
VHVPSRLLVTAISPSARLTPTEVRDALVELAARVAAHGPRSSGPGELALALGLHERTVRRLLARLDAEGLPVAVGWVRACGGGGVRARAVLREKRLREGETKESTDP